MSGSLQQDIIKEEKRELSTPLVRIIFYSLSILFVGIMLYGAASLTVPLLLAFFISFLLNPMVNLIEGLGISRVLSVIFAMIVVGLLFYALWETLYPVMSVEFTNFISRSDQLIAKATNVTEGIKTYLSRTFPAYIVPAEKFDIHQILNTLTGYLKDFSQKSFEALPGIFTQLLITPIMIFVLMLEGHEIYRRLVSMVPNRYFEMTILITHKVQSQIIAYLKGLLFQWVILFSILGGGFALIGLPYGVLTGAVAASVNIVPYLGPVMGAGAALLMALLSSNPESMVVMLSLVLGTAHIFDNIFTQPVILARSVDLHPLIAILALITFQNLMGVTGMVIAIPLTGIMLVTIEVMYRSLKSFRVI